MTKNSPATQIPSITPNDNPIRVALYRGAKNPEPRECIDVSWAELVESIRDLLDHEHPAKLTKLALPAFAPHRLSAPHRLEDNVTGVTALVIDVDKCDVEALLGRISALEIAAIVYASPSDDPDGPSDARHVRVIATVTREIAPDECRHTRLAFAEMIGLAPGCGADGALDAARLFFVGRLPGTPERAFVDTDGSPVDVDALMAAPLVQSWGGKSERPTAAATTTTRHTDDVTYARATALAERLPPSVEGHAGDAALFRCAREVATIIGEDAAAIEGVLTETYNPRCVPPWDAAKIAYEVKRAVASVSTPEARFGRRHDGRVTAAMAANDTAYRSTTEPDDDTPEEDGLEYGTLTLDPPPQKYLIPELEIGVGRPFGFLGKSNASKTIAIQQLEVDLALGRPIWGRFDGPGAPVSVMHIAYEAFTKLPEDYARLLRAAGVDDTQCEDVATRLRFCRGKRFLADERHTPEDIEAWLIRITAWARGGLVVIDPLVAACLGIDENTTAMAQPIYMLETVSRTNEVAIVVLHHLGHGEHERSRGSSAIEGAFGATALIAKDDGSINERSVKSLKRNRYGFNDIVIALHDTTQNGSKYVRSADDAKTGRCSWGLAIVARGADPQPNRKSDADRKRELKAQIERAHTRNRIERDVIHVLEQHSSTGKTMHGISRDVTGSKDTTREVVFDLVRQGVVRTATGGPDNGDIFALTDRGHERARQYREIKKPEVGGAPTTDATAAPPPTGVLPIPGTVAGHCRSRRRGK